VCHDGLGCGKNSVADPKKREKKSFAIGKKEGFYSLLFYLQFFSQRCVDPYRGLG
jgi:hypothetical protein